MMPRDPNSLRQREFFDSMYQAHPWLEAVVGAEPRLEDALINAGELGVDAGLEMRAEGDAGERAADAVEAERWGVGYLNAIRDTPE